MNRLAKLIFTESKLFLRDPMAVFFAVAFPPLLLAILGAIPAFREPNEDLGGARVIDLFVSEATIKTHLLHIYEKLGVRDRAAAVGEAYRRRLLS